MKSLFLAVTILAFFISFSQSFGETDAEKILVIENNWVQQHDCKIPEGLRSEIKRLLTTGNPSSAPEAYPSEKVPITDALKFGIPTNENKVCKLEELRKADIDGSVFLIADYRSHKIDPQDDEHISSVYIKFEDNQKLLFRENRCRLVSLGKNSPVFLEVENYCADGYGTALYSFKKGSLKKPPVFDKKAKGEILKAGYYLEKVLGFYIWQEGQFQYFKMDKDDNLEVVVKSTAEIPGELISIISKKLNWTYAEVSGDLTGPWGNVVSVYKWNGEKFENLADYYDH